MRVGTRAAGNVAEPRVTATSMVGPARSNAAGSAPTGDDTARATAALARNGLYEQFICGISGAVNSRRPHRSYANAVAYLRHACRLRALARANLRGRQCPL